VVDNGNINSVWDNVRENIKILAHKRLSYCELRHHKPWFDVECSKLVDERKQAKLQWLQVPSEVNEDNLSNIRQELVDFSGTRKGKEYFKGKISKPESNRKNKNISDLYRGINEFK
jgi:hypothetical protein